VSNELLCVITGLIPINIKIEETAKYYESVKGQGKFFYQEIGSKTLDAPNKYCRNYRRQEDRNYNIHVYTDGSKSEHGVGYGIAMFKDSKLIDTRNSI